MLCGCFDTGHSQMSQTSRASCEAVVSPTHHSGRQSTSNIAADRSVPFVPLGGRQLEQANDGQPVVPTPLERAPRAPERDLTSDRSVAGWWSRRLRELPARLRHADGQFSSLNSTSKSVTWGGFRRAISAITSSRRGFIRRQVNGSTPGALMCITVSPDPSSATVSRTVNRVLPMFPPSRYSFPFCGQRSVKRSMRKGGDREGDGGRSLRAASS